MSEQWYIKTKNGKRGPYTQEQLQRYIDGGALLPNAGLGKGGDDWVPAITVEGLVFSEEAIAQVRAALQARKQMAGMGTAASGGSSPAERDADSRIEEEREQLRQQTEALNSRSEELASRSAELDSRGWELESRAADLEGESTRLGELESTLHERSKTLDVSRIELDEREQLLDGREQELQRRETELEERASEIATEGAKRAEAETEAVQRAETLQLQMSELEKERDDLRIQLDERSLEQEQTRALLDQKSAELERRESEWADSDAQLDSRLSELETSQRQLERDQEELQADQREVEQARDDLASKEQDFSDRETALAERERSAAQADATLQEQGQQLAEREAELGARQSRVSDLQDACEQMRRRAEAAESEVETANEALRSLRETLDERESELVKVREQLAVRTESLEALQDQSLAETTSAELSEKGSDVEPNEMDSGQVLEEKRRLLKEFAERQASLAKREADLIQRESELTQRELDIAVLGHTAAESVNALAPTPHVGGDQIEAAASAVRKSPKEKLEESEDEVSAEPVVPAAAVEDSEVGPPDQQSPLESWIEHAPASRGDVDEGVEGVEDVEGEAPLSWAEALGASRPEDDRDPAFDSSHFEDPRFAPAPDESEDDFVGVSATASDETMVSVAEPAEGPTSAPADIQIKDRLPSELLPSELPEYDGVELEEGTQQERESEELPETPIEDSPLFEFRRSVYEERFGSCSRYEVDTDPNMRVDISVHAPNEKRDFSTIVTSGMSDYPIAMPNGQRSVRGELVLYVTHVDELAIDAIRGAAKIPYRKKQGLSIGTTGSLQDLIGDSHLTDCVYMLPVIESDSKPLDAKAVIGSGIQLFWLVTITEAERKLIETGGIHKFLSLLEKNNHAVYFDLTRDCYVKRKGWFRR